MGYLRSLSKLTFCSALITLLLTGSVAHGEDKPLNIVTTTGMITDLVSNIAGNRAVVSGLMGSGIDPHLYKPTRTDIAALSRADVVFYNGLFLEGKMIDALLRVARAGKKVFPLTELLDKSLLLEPAEFSGQFDPHVWMDPTAWAQTVGVVRDSLSKLDPNGAAEYTKNAERYAEELRKLHLYAEQVLKTVPENARVLVTAHDAFSYFGKRYGFEVVGIQGLSTESEAGVRDVERIVGLLVSRKIPAVFIESTVADRNVRALIEGAAARGHRVEIGGMLYSDAMGEPGSYRGTYIGMIDHNVTAITRALGGNAPAGGMNGKLMEDN